MYENSVNAEGFDVLDEYYTLCTAKLNALNDAAVSYTHLVADQALHSNGGLPTSERAAEAVLAVCRRLSDTCLLYTSKAAAALSSSCRAELDIEERAGGA